MISIAELFFLQSLENGIDDYIIYKNDRDYYFLIKSYFPEEWFQDNEYRFSPLDMLQDKNYWAHEVPNWNRLEEDSAVFALSQHNIPNAPHILASCTNHNMEIININGLKEIEIPRPISKIDNRAFSFFMKLEKVEFPDSLKEIGEKAFYGCHALASIDIPDNVVEVGTGAFAECHALSKIVLPDRIQKIGNHAFDNISPDAVFIYRGNTFEKGDIDALNSTDVLGSLTRLDNDLELTGENEIASVPRRRGR